MKLFLYIILLPCAWGVDILCSDGYICPEGTQCCKTHDSTIRCCDNDNNSTAATHHKKALLYSPAEEAHHFPNTSDSHMIMNTYCSGDCGIRPCCSGTCCPYPVGRCCVTGCCRSGYHCCGDVTEGDTEWCCPTDKSCSTYMKGLCVGGGVSLIPSLAVTFVISVLSVRFLQATFH